ncbi:MAG: GerMN domain-containing protein [Candidatus Obscuribacterales bacterium]|nr:GerMN domain-containing protein [Candidatus Obscuribacterales bacterium]
MKNQNQPLAGQLSPGMRLAAISISCIITLSSCVHRMILTDISAGSKVKNPAQDRFLKEAAKLTDREASSGVWFVKSNGKEVALVKVKRSAVGKNRIESAVQALLDGPSNQEIQEGLGSEIPRGTVLLGVNEKSGAIILDLSRRFASGGGIDSIETRLEQLSRTVSSVADQVPVYLNIEGQRLTMTEGEGIEIKQPINQ